MKFVIEVENDFRDRVCKEEKLQDILPELQPLQKQNENNHCRMNGWLEQW